MLLIQSVRHLGCAAVVEIEGRLDTNAIDEVKGKLRALVDEGHARLVLNVSEMSFIDSSGLGVLVSSLRHAVDNGADVILVGVPDFCLSIFHLTRLSRVFRICETEEDALDLLEQKDEA